MLELLNSLAVSFDLPILNWIQSNLQCTFLDYFMRIITWFGDGGIFWIACAVILLFFPKYRKAALTMGLALIMGVLICNVTIKPLVGRPRPLDFAALNNIAVVYPQHLVDIWGKEVVFMADPSFPSGHTIASFEASVALLMYSKKLGIPALILAILVSLSRLYLFVHYPTDVLVSVVLGTLFALIAYAIMKNRKFCDPKYGKYERTAA